MNLVTQLIAEQWVISALQIILSALIKPQLKDKLLGYGMKATGLIPLINILIGYLGFQLAPASAQAAMLVASVVPVKEGLSVLALAVVQQILVTGAYSTFKNTAVPVSKVMLSWLISKVSPWVARG